MTQIGSTQANLRFLDNLQNSIANSQAETTVVSKNSGLSKLGAFKTFFTFKSTHQKTIDQFKSSLVAKYGPQIANQVSAQSIDGLRAEGKPLKVQTIRNAIQMAEDSKAHNAIQNRLNGHSFVFLSLPGSAFSLDYAVGQYLVDKGLSAEKAADIKDFLRSSLPEFLSTQDKTLMTGADIFDLIQEGGIPGLEEVAADKTRGVDGSTIDSMGSEERLDFAKALAKFTPPNSSGIGNFSSMFHVKYPDMNRNGASLDLSPQNIWSTILPDTPMPAKFATGDAKTLQGFARELDDAILNSFETKHPKQVGSSSFTEGGQALKLIMVGIKPEAALEIIKGEKRSLNLDDFVGGARHYSLPKISIDMDYSENAVARDLHRRGHKETLPSSITITQPGGSTLNVTMPKVDEVTVNGAVPADLATYKEGKLNSVSAQIRQDILRLCGQNEDQAKIVMRGLSQEGPAMIMRHVGTALGVTSNEHVGFNISLSKNDSGDIVIQFRRPEGSQPQANMDFIVRPDGTSASTDFQISTNLPPVVNL